MSIDVDDLGSCVFEELACEELEYNPFLTEFQVLDHYGTERNTHLVVLLVNELGKNPYKVVLETKVISVAKARGAT